MFLKVFLKVYVIVFENNKDVCFEIEQAIRSNIPTQKVLGVLFPLPLDVAILPLFW